MIVKRLFLNSEGVEADRLVLFTIDGKDLGGWCKGSVEDLIRDELDMPKRRVKRAHL